MRNGTRTAGSEATHHGGQRAFITFSWSAGDQNGNFPWPGLAWPGLAFLSETRATGKYRGDKWERMFTRIFEIMSRAHTKGSALHWQAPPALQQESAETLMTMDLNLKSTTLPERNIESPCDSGAIQPRPRICASGNDLASQNSLDTKSCVPLTRAEK